MSKRAFVFVAVALYALAPSDVHADSATAVIQISANVRKNCLITTTPVAYGGYDPVGANATPPLHATRTVVLPCTKGTTASIALDGGANAQGPARRMTDGAAAYLSYELYQDTSHATIWSSTGGGLLTAAPAPSKDPRSYTVYGRVGGAQDVPVGTFTDSVVATVNF